jgi:hypothetical protein
MRMECSKKNSRSLSQSTPAVGGGGPHSSDATDLDRNRKQLVLGARRLRRSTATSQQGDSSDLLGKENPGEADANVIVDRKQSRIHSEGRKIRKRIENPKVLYGPAVLAGS